MQYIKARFIGKHLSLGYRKGAFYTLRVSELVQGLIFQKKFIQIVNDTNSQVGYCIYSSIDSFLYNWTDIKVLH